MSLFASRLKLLRLERKLSRGSLAKTLGVSQSSINMYERGEREPGLETLEAIADYFNVDMDYLLGKSEIKNKSPLNLAPSQALISTSDNHLLENALINSFRQLNAAGKNKVIGYIKGLIDSETYVGGASDPQSKNA